MNEVAGLQIGHLRHHHRQQRVTCDVERHAKKDIRRALVKLAGELALGDVELKQAVARRQRHVGDVRRVPGRNDDTAAVGIGFQRVNNFGDLIDRAAVGVAQERHCLP